MHRPETKSDKSGLKFLLILVVWIAVLIGIATTMLAQSSQPAKPVDPPASIDGMKVSGPYIHKNLAVYLILSFLATRS